MGKKLLVSACLLGRNCKYNGGNNYCAAVAEFVKDKEIIEVCPEVQSGMSIPRTPIELVNGVLMDRDGNDVDARLRAAVAQTMEFIKDEEKCECHFAVAQSHLRCQSDL